MGRLRGIGFLLKREPGAAERLRHSASIPAGFDVPKFPRRGSLRTEPGCFRLLEYTLTTAGRQIGGTRTHGGKAAPAPGHAARSLPAVAREFSPPISEPTIGELRPIRYRAGRWLGFKLNRV